MKTEGEVRDELEQLKKRNLEIDEITKNVEIAWGWSVNNPLFHERHWNLVRIVALNWILGETDL